MTLLPCPFHAQTIAAAIDPSREQIAAIERQSFISKSGKQTWGVDNFYNGSISKSQKGLEISVISVVDVLAHQGYTLSVQQTAKTDRQVVWHVSLKRKIRAIAAAPLIGLGGVPLSPLQILWMNLVTDGIPAIALALEPGESDVMERKPFQPTESIFARGLGGYIIRIGLVFAIVTIGLMGWAFVGEASPTGESHPLS